MFEQLPPFDQQAEESVIAALMVDANALDAVLPILAPSDFFREANAWTYAACAALYDRGEDVNQVTVAHELDSHDRLIDAGGLTFLSELILNLPTSLIAESCANLVKAASMRRRLIDAAYKTMRLGYDESTDLDSALAAAERLIRDLSTGQTYDGLVQLRTLLDPYMDAAVERETAGGAVADDEGTTTGLRDLDRLLGSLMPGSLAIVGARTSMGKTALMLHVTRHVARHGGRVAIFEAEMSGAEIAGRMLSAEAGVDSKRLRPGRQNEDEEARVIRAHGEMASWEVYVRDDAARMDLQSIRTGLRRLIREQGPVDLVVVDYLQIMDNVEHSRGGNRVQEVSELSRGLKKIAREHAVPLLAGSQLSRKVDDRLDHHPMLSDLRESGSIEQDADVVLFIYREEAYTTREQWESLHPDHLGDPYPQGIAELIVAKHRNGPTGYVDTRFVDAFSRFEDLVRLER